MKSFWKKHPYISFGITALIVIAGVFFFLKYFSFEKDDTIALVEKGTLVRSVKTQGEVVVGADYTVSFMEGGIVDAVFVWPGKKVAKGELLVTLTNSKERAVYKKAQVALLKAQEKYRKIVSGTQILQEEVDEALADVVFAQAAAESTRATLEKTRVRAPIDSTVVSVSTRLGSMVNPEQTVVILRDTKNNYFVAKLSPEQSIFVAAGQPTIGTIESDIVKSVVSGVFAQGEEYIVTSLLPANTKYEAKTPGTMEIVTAQVDSAIIIPRYALIESTEGYTVERVEDGRKISIVPVQVGLTGDNDRIQITEGLSEGDRIVWQNSIAEPII